MASREQVGLLDGALAYNSLVRSVAIAVLLASQACGSGDATSFEARRAEWLERIAARPLPDLATLAERSHRGAEGAFEDVLKLRQDGAADAVPALIEILDTQASPTRIEGLAAAQALFRIGGEEAHARLRATLGGDAYPWEIAVDCAFRWHMEGGLRDRFFARYLLRPTNAALKARLTCDRGRARRGEDVTFTLALANVTSDGVALASCQGRLDADLAMREKDGPYAWVRRVDVHGLGALPPPLWRTLEAGQTVEFRFVRAFLPAKRGSGRFRSHGIVRELLIETESGAGGAFEVTGIFSRTYARGEGNPPKPPWLGRVVCAPIPLTITD